MPPRSDKKCCIEAEQALRHADLHHVPPIQHTCNDKKGQPTADKIPGTRLTQYCSAVLQGTGVTPLVLIPTKQYAVCREMRRRLIDTLLNNSSVRTTKIDSNNNTTTEEVHADSNNNNNNNTGFVLVPNIKLTRGWC